jgi:protoheme IX farnesyltransferase
MVAHSPLLSITDSRMRRVMNAARAYVMLTKPRVVELLLVTTVPAMILAQEGLPDLALVAAVLVGGSLAAGGANTINCWIERDRDRIMNRTRHRPLPAGTIGPNGALTFGLLLEVAAFAILWSVANLESAALAFGAALFYVFVYTIWLKPRTAQNIVIGGAAGAVPVLVGWAAVTGSVATPAWVLFAVIFFWTPSHFWALALRYRDDYAAADFPMLPVTQGTQAAVRQILAYAVVVTAVSLLLPAVSPAGVLYLVAAAALGAGFIGGAERLRRNPTADRAIRYFAWSNAYLALLFAAVAVDTFLRHA